MSKSNGADWEAAGDPQKSQHQRPAANLPVPRGQTVPQKPRRGRPPALDERKKREVCALISAGSGLGRAAQYVGCAPSTIRTEARRDPAFDQQMRDAALASELEPLRAIKRAAGSHWRAAAWYLERAESDRFGRRPADSIKPEEVTELLDEIGLVIANEIKNDELHDRIVRRVKKVTRKWEREAAAARPTTTRK